MKYIILSIFTMATVTYLVRVLPVAVFKKQITSKWVKSFLFYVPFAVLGSMTFPAILYSTNNMISAVAGMAAAIILSYFERGLMTTALSCALVVYVVNLVL